MVFISSDMQLKFSCLHNSSADSFTDFQLLPTLLQIQKLVHFFFFFSLLLTFLLAIQLINSRAVTIRLLRNTTLQFPHSLRDVSFIVKPPQEKRQRNVKEIVSFIKMFSFSFHLWHINKYCSCVFLLLFQASTRQNFFQ